MTNAELRCDKCGATSRAIGMQNVPEYIRPFVRGEVVVTLNPLGICSECYAVLCMRCADHGKCSMCTAPWPLFAECPSSPPEDPTKMEKWKRIRKLQFGSSGDNVASKDDKGKRKDKKWWQFWK